MNLHPRTSQVYFSEEYYFKDKYLHDIMKIFNALHSDQYSEILHAELNLKDLETIDNDVHLGEDT